MLVASLAALIFIPAVLAQSNYNLTGLLQVLNASNLHQLVNATARLNSTSTGKYVLTELSQGNSTIFAPTDIAFSSADPAILNNQSALADLVSYHIIPANFVNQTKTYPNLPIGRTLLNASNLVTLEGNQSQVLIWSKSNNGSFFVTNRGSNVTVVNTTTYEDTAILTVDRVLTPPPDTTTIMKNPSCNLTSLANFLQSTNVKGTSLLNRLSSAHGITLFAPNNAGLQLAQSSLASLSKNTTALQNVVNNHFINATSYYSTEISNQTTFVSAAGQNYSFFANSTGEFVSVGGSNEVRVLKKNVLMSNGVIHIVSGVMFDTNANPALASTAYASATSIAAHTTDIGPIAFTPSTSGETVKTGASNWKLMSLRGYL
ncbi:FAS1 domain-containing protein [Chiua virens]|nr:FAS1 domain-containing protein [Chiua virens]